jgi:hypothetical protein
MVCIKKNSPKNNNGMISERDIAEKFSVVWNQHFPMLTSNFIKIFNETQIKISNSISIPIIENVRYDLITESAFNLAEILFVYNKTPEEYISNQENLNDLIKYTAKGIWKNGNYTEEDLKLIKSEVEEIIKISKNIIEFINTHKFDKLEFKPKIIGYGFIPDLIADLSIDDTLFEIKSVNRNFKSSDLKQLFIYLALQQVSTGKNWDFAGLYNPRRGTYCKFNIKQLVYTLSGGKSPNEAFENLLNNLVRGIEIDSRF